MQGSRNPKLFAVTEGLRYDVEQGEEVGLQAPEDFRTRGFFLEASVF